MSERSSESGEPALRRDIGFVGSAFLSFNGIVGAGIFALPAVLYSDFGDFSPWLFPLFGILILIVALPFAQLSAHVPGSGGPVAYAAPFGPAASFQAGWLYYVARVTALAANANVFVIYAATLWAPIGDGAARVVAIIALVALLTWINIVGVKRAIRALDAMTILKAGPLIGFALYALYLSAGSLGLPDNPPPLSEVEAAALLILYAFVGFENSVVPAGETANARRTIPRALIATLAGTAALYFIVQLAYVAVMPGIDGGDAPLVTFGSVLAGPAGALLLTVAALASLAGNLMGSMTSTPRATYALAEGGLLPRWFGRLHPRHATPANSILFMGLLGAALAVSGSFVWLAVASTLARLIVYSTSIAALPRVRAAAGVTHGKGIVIAMMVAALSVCAWAAFQSSFEAWRLLAILVVAGTALYFAARMRARRG